MKPQKNQQTSLKQWNVGLKVSLEEKNRIKLEAMKREMNISEYVKQRALGEL